MIYLALGILYSLVIIFGVIGILYVIKLVDSVIKAVIALIEWMAG